MLRVVDERLNTRVPSEVLERAKRRAEAEHRTLANLVRLALIEYLDRRDAEDSEQR